MQNHKKSRFSVTPERIRAIIETITGRISLQIITDKEGNSICKETAP